MTPAGTDLRWGRGPILSNHQRDIIHKEVRGQEDIARTLEGDLDGLAFVRAQLGGYRERVMRPTMLVEITLRLHSGDCRAAAGAQAGIEVIVAGRSGHLIGIDIRPVTEGHTAKRDGQGDILPDLVVTIVVAAEIGAIGSAMRSGRINQFNRIRAGFVP